MNEQEAAALEILAARADGDPDWDALRAFLVSDGRLNLLRFAAVMALATVFLTVVPGAFHQFMATLVSRGEAPPV